MGGAGSVHGEGGENTEGAGFTGATADLLVEGEAEISALACDEIFEAAKSVSSSSSSVSRIGTPTR